MKNQKTMKTKYFKLASICLVSLFLLSSCLGDLDTLPLDDNELVGRRFILRLRDTSEYWQSVTPALSRPDKRVVMAETATCRVLMKVIVAIHVLCSICKRLVRMRSFSIPVESWKFVTVVYELGPFDKDYLLFILSSVYGH